MPVRITESRIPGGFDKASELGYAKYSEEDNNYVVISQLTNTLRIDLTDLNKKPLLNRYFAFVNSEGVAIETCDAINYTWTLLFYGNDSEEPLLDPITKITNYGYCLLSTYPKEDFTNVDENYIFSLLEHPDIFALSPTRIVVKLNFNGPDIEIQVDHTINGLLDNIESLIESEPDKPHAKAGATETTRKIANDYRDYLIDRTWNLYNEKLENSDIPLNLLTSVIYLNSMSIPEYDRINNDSLWENYINFNEESTELYNLPLGPAQIIPNFLTMFLPKPDDPGGENLNPLIYIEDSETYTDFLSLSFTNFHSLVAEDQKYKTDFINLARFPKSAIKLLDLYLFFLVERFRASSSTCDPPLIERRPCLTSVLTEYISGPHKNEFEIEKTTNKYFDFMFYPFIQKIIETSDISYELLNIKVLDIRSGEPIRDTVVKRIIVNHGERRYGHSPTDFCMNSDEHGTTKNLRTKNKISPGDSIRKKAQKSLNMLGYYHGNPGNTFGNNGRTQYNNYWRDRSVDEENPIDQVNEGNPEDIYLEEIVREYEIGGSTNEAGIITLRIPTDLFNNQPVHVEIAFWDFPIVCEALVENEDMLSRPANSESATNFQISWIGDIDGNTQVAEIENYFEDDTFSNDKHFGWKVKGEIGEANLKVIDKLILKSNSEEFLGFDVSLFSKYFNQQLNPVQFVLFGMQWCQPVWDKVTDPISNKRSNEYSFVNRKTGDDKWIKDTNLHIVSKFVGSADDPFGHYYGFFDVESPYHRLNTDGTGRRHQGIDLYTGPSSEIDCFAVHGGLIENISGSSGYANQIKLKLTDNSSKPYFRYAHLKSHIEELDKKMVMCGQKIGITDRSGFPANLYPSHMHFELNKADGTDVEPYLINNLDIEDFKIDDINVLILPSNNLPIMLPCVCKFGGTYNAPSACNFSKKDVLKTCWAVQEFPYTELILNESSNNNPDQHQVIPKDDDEILYYACPHILQEDSDEDSKTQALLRFLFYNKGKGSIDDGDFFNPGTIDGNIGDEPDEISVIGLIQNKGVEILTGDGTTQHDLLIKVKFVQEDGTEVIGWIENSLLDSDNNLNISSLESLIDGVISKSRMSIYMFKKVRGILNYINYANNFSMDNSSFTLLHSLINIEMP